MFVGQASCLLLDSRDGYPTLLNPHCEGKTPLLDLDRVEFVQNWAIEQSSQGVCVPERIPWVWGIRGRVTVATVPSTADEVMVKSP